MIKRDLILFIISLLLLVFGWGVSWSAYGARLSELEDRSNIYARDHDIIIELNTKMDILLKNVCDIQKDLKEHLKSHNGK